MATELDACEFEQQWDDFANVEDRGVFSPIIVINGLSVVGTPIIASFSSINNNPGRWRNYYIAKPQEVVV